MPKSKSLISSFTLSFHILLSSVLGYSDMSDANERNEIQRPGNHYPPYPLLNQHRKQDVSATRHGDDLSDLAPTTQQQSYSEREKDYLKEVESSLHGHGVNETLWAAVVDAARRKPFDWTELSRALDFIEGDFERRSSSRLNSTNSHEADEELKNEFSKSEMKSRTSRWKFTYHRVLTFLRNDSTTGLGERRAIAAVSVSEIRPSSSSSPPSFLHYSLPSLSSTSSLITNPFFYPKNKMSNVNEETLGQGTPPSAFTSENEIISRLLHKNHHHHYHHSDDDENIENDDDDEDYHDHDQRLDSSSSSSSTSTSTSLSSSSRYFLQRLRKLSSHSHGSGHHHPVGSLNYHYHRMTNYHHDPNSSNRPYGHSHHSKRHNPMV